MTNTRKTWFITGTDTEIGKTYVSTCLLKALNSANMPANGYKPVASGAQESAFGFKNPDAIHHLQNSFDQLSYDAVNPYFFEAEEAPHILAEKLNTPILLSKMSEGLAALEAKERITLVEGAGGWYTPLSLTTSYSDWVAEEQLPVIVVVGLKLGVINHARLTFDAIESKGLKITGWIANHLSDSPSLPSYIEAIKAFSDIPMIGEIPFNSNSADHSQKKIRFDLSVFQ